MKRIDALYRKEWFSITLILVLLFTEVSIINYIDGRQHFITGLLGLILFASAFVIGWRRKFYFLLPSKSTIQKFVGNTLGSSWVSLVCLFIFIAELSWLVDSGYSLFIDPPQCSFDCILFLKFLIIILTLYLLICLISHRPKNTIKIEDREFLIAPISVTHNSELNFDVFGIRNFDLLRAPLLSNGSHLGSDKEFSGVELSGIKELHIILSDKFESCRIDDSLLSEYGYTGTDNKDFLTKALQKVYEKSYGRKIKVTYSVPVNYDVFSNIYEAMEKALESEYSSTAILYISPGTSVTSAALSYFAVLESRCLLYLQQSQNQLVPIQVDIFTQKLINTLISERELSD